MRIAIYARVSTADKDKDQDPETQLCVLRDFISSQEDWTVIGEFVDHAPATDLPRRER